MMKTQDKAIGFLIQLRNVALDIEDAEKENKELRQDKTFRFLPQDRDTVKFLKASIIKKLENIKV